MAHLPSWDTDLGGISVNHPGLCGQLAHWSTGATSEAKLEQKVAVQGGTSLSPKSQHLLKMCTLMCHKLFSFVFILTLTAA